MTDSPAGPAAARPAAPAPATALEPDAIGVVQDTVIGMASSAPAATVGLTLASLAMATAYGSGPILILTALPMLVIANAYRRLNMWNAHCGASFEWVGRAINPYLGFLTGWLMVVAYIIGTVSAVEVLGPSLLAVAGSGSQSAGADFAIATVTGLVMLVIAIVGIRITARAQVVMGAVEYAILVGFGVAGLVVVLRHHAGTYPVTSGWLSPDGVGGHGSAVAGFLAAVFVYGGWDGTLYVNEEVTNRRVNPGRAALLAVAFLAVIYTLSQIALQGVVSPARLQQHSDSALVYVAQVLGGTGWEKVMALALALSVVATTGTGIVLSARIVYSMASRRVLPPSLARVSGRFATPVAASIICGLLIVGLSGVYLLAASSVQNAFNDVVDITGLLFSIFYIMTALTVVVYYRRLVASGVRDAVVLGVLPVAAAVFLGWILAKNLLAAPAAQIGSIIAIVGLGVIAMLFARFGLRSEFFSVPRESYRP
ncbi:MAG: APC family permease [Actinomycetota bacterium]